MDFDAVADELYGLRPEDFTGARNERVRQARAEGQRDIAERIGQLRRPTVSAWVVNLLVRQAGGELTGLLDLGEQLRGAQAASRGDEIRALTERRRQLVSALASTGRRFADDAGRPVGESAMQEVERTVEAALADPDASATVRGGRLTTALSYSGLGLVDAFGATAMQAPRPASDRRGRGGADQDGPDAAEDRRSALAEAEDEVRRLEQDDERARSEEDEARARKDAADQRVAELEAELDRARAVGDSVAGELRDAAERRAHGARGLAKARKRAERARSRLDELGD